MSCRQNGVLCVWVLVCIVVCVLDVFWLQPSLSDVHCKRCACENSLGSLPARRDQPAKSLQSVHTTKRLEPAPNVMTSRSDVRGLGYLDKLSRDRYEACKPRQRRPSTQTVQCHDLTFQEGKNPIVALASTPGSGNTWVRYLLEQATGVYTGSIYCDTDLKAIYPGEKVVSGNVIVVKTHRYATLQLPSDVQEALGKTNYDKVILLIRNPYNCLLSEANRKWNVDSSVSNHVGLASDIFLTGKQHFARAITSCLIASCSAHCVDITRWNQFVLSKSGAWLAVLRTWLKQDHMPVMIVQYEKLVTDLRGEMLRILNFLGQQVSNESLDCAIENANGSLRRTRHLSVDPFSKDNNAVIDRVLEEARPILQRYNVSYSMPVIVNAEPPQRTS